MATFLKMRTFFEINYTNWPKMVERVNKCGDIKKKDFSCTQIFGQLKV